VGEMIDPRLVLVGKDKCLDVVLLINAIPLEGHRYESKGIMIGDHIEYWDKDFKRRLGQVYKIYPRKGEMRVRLDSDDMLKRKQVIHKEKIGDFQILEVFHNAPVEDLYDPTLIDPITGKVKQRQGYHTHDDYVSHPVGLKNHKGVEKNG